MKKLTLIGVLAIVVVIVIAVVTAGQMGETNHAMVRGKVVLAPDLKGKTTGAETLFIIVGYPDRPMPYGAFKKTVGGNLEGTIYEFALTNDNLQRMMPDQAWPAQFKLKARLDRDGIAGADQPGDLVGEVFPVSPGSEGVEIVINRVID